MKNRNPHLEPLKRAFQIFRFQIISIPQFRISIDYLDFQTFDLQTFNLPTPQTLKPSDSSNPSTPQNLKPSKPQNLH